MSEENGQSGADELQTPAPASKNEEGILESLSLKPTEPQKNTEVKPEVKTEVTDENKFPRSENPGENLVLTWLEKMGYNPTSPAIVSAWEDGDFSLLKAELASREDAKGSAEYLSLAEKLRQDGVVKEAEKVINLEKLVLEEAGGQEAWTEVRDWARANGTDEEKTVFNQMIEAGGLATKIAVNYMTNKYRESTSTLENPPSPVSIPAQAGSSASYALSPPEYIRAVKELASKVGSENVTSSPAYELLQKRRLSWRG